MIEGLVWAIPLVAILFDMLALYNIGPYIKNYIEPTFRENASGSRNAWSALYSDTRLPELSQHGLNTVYGRLSIGYLVAVWHHALKPIHT